MDPALGDEPYCGGGKTVVQGALPEKVLEVPHKGLRIELRLGDGGLDGDNCTTKTAFSPPPSYRSASKYE